MSAFAIKDGVVHHTYSTYDRCVDQLMGTYRMLDLAPLGRNEEGPAAWWHRHDEYETAQHPVAASSTDQPSGRPDVIWVTKACRGQADPDASVETIDGREDVTATMSLVDDWEMIELEPPCGTAPGVTRRRSDRHRLSQSLRALVV